MSKGKYKDLIDINLRAWHKFIPDYTTWDSNNCWHSQTLDLSALPPATKKKFSDIEKIAGLENKFPVSKVDQIMRTVLIGNDTSSSHTLKENYYCMPKTLVMGFPECGATLMHRNLCSHQEYAEPHWKELHFWRELVRTSDIRYKEMEVLLYLNHFRSPSQRIEKREKTFLTDASISTVFTSAQPFRQEEDTCVIPLTLFSIAPHVKFVILLRNPVEQL